MSTRFRVIVVQMTIIAQAAVVLAHDPAAQAVSRPAAVLVAEPSGTAVGTSVLLRGRVADGVRSARIETRIAGRWVPVRRISVRQHRFRSRVVQWTTVARYRLSARRHGAPIHSRVRVVRLRPARGSVATSTAVSRRPSDACGVRPVKADGTLWSCTFADDFAGPVLDRSKWMPQTQFASGSATHHACYADDPSTIRQSGGVLQLTLHRVILPVWCRVGGVDKQTDLVSGSVMTYHLFSQKYGRFEARIKNTATTMPGLQETFWLWPDDRVASTAPWPYSGEIDVSETYSSHPGLAIPFLHYAADAGGPQPGVNTAWDCAAARGEWNTYTLTWSAHRIEIDVNGRPCLVNTSGDPAFDKPYIVLLTQALGSAGNDYDGRAPIPATMSIDYLRVWR